jgi:hypothetical protein
VFRLWFYSGFSLSPWAFKNTGLTQIIVTKTLNGLPHWIDRILVPSMFEFSDHYGSPFPGAFSGHWLAANSLTLLLKNIGFPPNAPEDQGLR